MTEQTKRRGRPPIEDHKRRRTLSIRISPDVKSYLKRRGNAAALIEELVKRSKEYKERNI